MSDPLPFMRLRLTEWRHAACRNRSETAGASVRAMRTATAFNPRLRMAIKQSHLSLREISTRLLKQDGVQIGRSTLSNWQNNASPRRGPTEDTRIYALERVLRLRRGELLLLLEEGAADPGNGPPAQTGGNDEVCSLCARAGQLDSQELRDPRNPPEMLFVIDEAAFAPQVAGSGETAHRQFEGLGTCAEGPHVLLRVLPFAAAATDASPGMAGGFVLLEFDGFDPDSLEPDDLNGRRTLEHGRPSASGAGPGGRFVAGPRAGFAFGAGRANDSRRPHGRSRTPDKTRPAQPRRKKSRRGTVFQT